MPNDTCCAADQQIMLLACSGGSNVGQLSNQAVVELTQEGFGKMFCLAGIGAQLSGFVQSAKDVSTDGCHRRLPSGMRKGDFQAGRSTLETLFCPHR